MSNFTIPSVDHVREIIVTEVSNSIIESCISSASAAIESSIPSHSISNSLALEIQRWLAAHFVSVQSPDSRVLEEKIGDSGIKYGPSAAVTNFSQIERFSSTFYGRTAVDLDPTGNLRGKSGRIRKQRVYSV